MYQEYPTALRSREKTEQDSTKAPPKRVPNKLFFGKNSPVRLVISMVMSTLACYAVGTLWYMIAYGTQLSGNILYVLMLCVFPFVIPDAIKIFAAYLVSSRLSAIIRKHTK